MSDFTPIVVLDDVEAAALPAATGDAPAPDAYLATVGITAPSTLTAFGIGSVDAVTEARLRPGQRRLTGPGLTVPTIDPRDSSITVGLIRQTPGQHKHAFSSAPAGLLAPVYLDQHGRVVLCDNPLLTLRLHQEGVGDVAGVEDVAVLPPLAAWLAAREIVLVSTKKPGIAAMRAALEALGIRVAQAIILPSQVERISDGVRALLGLAPRVTAPVATAPLSLVTVRDIYEYALRQRETDAGMTALRAAGFDQPDLIAAYQPGYLPERYRDILPADQRGNFGVAWNGNIIVIPAFDERSVVVDLLAIKPESNHTAWSLWSEPRGLIAPVLATAVEHLVVTDTPRRLGRLSRSGTPALLMRGAEDAHANAARLVAGGVQSVEVRAHRDGDAIGAALAAAGLSVQVVRNPYGQHLASLAALRASRSRKAEEADVDAGLVGNPDEDYLDVPADATPAQEEADDAEGPVEPALVEPEPAPQPVIEPVVATTPVLPPVPPAIAAVVAPPAAPALPTLVLVEHDRQAERAVFTFGAGTYTATVPLRPTSTLTISVAGPRRSQTMTCDIAVEAARRRNAAMVAAGTGLPVGEVTAALVAILPAVLALITPSAPAIAPLNPTMVPMRADERDEAMCLLKAGDLVPRMVAALGSLGADPDDPSTPIGLLTSISRFGDRPIWTALTATMPSERFPALAAIAQATPAEHVVHVTRLTAEALNHQDPEALRHRLVILGDAAEISERAATSLRLLHDRGVLATSTVERTTQHGGLRTRVVEVHGPIAVIAAATTALPHGLDHHLFAVPVDDSPEAQVRQRHAIDQPMADPATLASAQRHRASAIRRLQNAQRLLIPRPVAIPDIAGITLPAALAGNRLHHDTLIGLIQASALLHQHQRPTVEGCVVATTADTDLAVRLLHHVAALQSAGMSRSAHRMLTTLWAGKRTRFSMDDLDALLPGWTRWAYRAALAELVALDFVAAGRGGRGKLRDYTLVATAPPTSAIRMPVPGPASPASEVAHG